MTKLPTLPEDTVSKLVALRDNKPEFHAYVKALRLKSWPLRAIAAPFSVSRTAASDWEKAYDGVTVLPEVPSMPVVAPKERKSSYERKELTRDEINSLRSLAVLASEVRRHTADNSPSRNAAKILEERLIEYANQGVTRTQLAEYCNVSRSSIQQRLAKYDK
jgi:hypothetical protein